MERSMKLDKITLGTCYYPEHWPEEMWKRICSVCWQAESR